MRILGKSQRYAFFAAVVAIAAGCLALTPILEGAWIGAVAFGALAAVGLWDLVQTRHAVLRNYPVLGHLRYFFETIRPEIRQYLLESDHDEEPFSRDMRSLIYQRAKGDEDKRPFGTRESVYGSGYAWVTHSAAPKQPKSADPRVRIGGSDCAQPYDASLYNISAMSFGSLSANAILALNTGARIGKFAHDTGEGGISRYHLEGGGDLVFQVASGYFGCRSPDGRFDPDAFARQASLVQVRMIEIKLSQGAKPGHGGTLPAAKISPEIARTRGIPMGVDCVSPPAHPEFSTPLELCAFIGRLRELSGGKPVGFKLCIGHRREFMCIVKAMLETGIAPDFVVVDGSEGGTGAAPVEFADHVGMPLVEGLTFVHNTLRGAGLRSRIRIGASGKIVSAFDIARALAIGADWTNSARGFMFALGCIQAQACHTNTCPSGVATQDGLRQRALVVSDKSRRVARFHANTIKALSEMAGAAGLDDPRKFEPRHLMLRTGDNVMREAVEVYSYLPEGFLLEGRDVGGSYLERWNRADPRSFAAPDAPKAG